MSIRVCLDAGHYGKYNRSPAIPEYYESEMAWKLHLLLKKYLESFGIEVIQTRSNQKVDLGLVARGKCSEGCDLFISLHSNATSGTKVNEKTDYPVAIVQLDGKGDILGKKLADCMRDTIGTKQAGQIFSMEGNNGEYYGVLRGAAAVGVMGIILEHSFHTCTATTRWLMDENNLDKMARAEAKIIADYLGAKTDAKVENDVNINLPILKRGTKGEEVKTVQRILASMGYTDTYGKTLDVDGSFGSKTEYAIKAFQKAEKISVDGAIGSNTWNCLLK